MTTTEEYEQARRSSFTRLLGAIDGATCHDWDSHLRDIHAVGPGEYEERVQANQERIGDALAAITLLLLRRDNEMWDAWIRYE